MLDVLVNMAQGREKKGAKVQTSKLPNEPKEIKKYYSSECLKTHCALLKRNFFFKKSIKVLLEN